MGLVDRTALLREMFPEGGAVAEIGVATGSFASEILSVCEPSVLHLVDAWRFIPGPYEADPTNRTDHVREAEYLDVKARLGCDPRVVLYRMLSKGAARLFSEGSLDAVYLDADHTKGGIRSDLELWWPKVKSGGILAGHDYTVREPFIQVKPVVDEWATRLGLGLVITEEPDYPSWAAVKP